MRIVLAVAILVALAVPAPSQTPTGSATAKGTCNVANSGSQNIIVIKNCGIGKEQAEKIVSMLKAALSNRSITEINAKLDELLALASKASPTLSCIDCNLAGTNNGMQSLTNNYGAPQPPPNLVGLTTKALNPIPVKPNTPPDPMNSPLSINPGVSVTFGVDRIFQNPMFILLCDKPCSTTTAFAGGASAPQMLSVPENPRLVGVALGLMGPLMPGNLVTIEVRSADSQAVNILTVAGYVPPVR
jgi:hypothetical protein